MTEEGGAGRVTSDAIFRHAFDGIGGAEEANVRRGDAGENDPEESLSGDEPRSHEQPSVLDRLFLSIIGIVLGDLTSEDPLDEAADENRAGRLEG